MPQHLRRSLLTLLMVPVVGIWLAVTAGVAAAVDASTAPIDVGFENDVTGSKAPGFTSVDSPLLSFDAVDYPGGTSSCNGTTTCLQRSNVTVYERYGVNDTQSLFTSTPGSEGLRITFAQPTQFVRLVFGDVDQPLTAGDQATLTGFFNGTRLASTSIPRDTDELTNQTIQLQGFVINSAVFQFTTSTGAPDFLIEFIDDVHSDPLCSVFGNNGNNTLTGTADIDVMCGGPGSDTLNGLGDNDLMFGNAGMDTLNGGLGMDRMFGGAAFDTCNGGPGTDQANSCESRTSVP